jgi:hypothetical protein
MVEQKSQNAHPQSPMFRCKIATASKSPTSVLAGEKKEPQPTISGSAAKSRA